MSQNNSVIDQRPNNQSVVDTRPQNNSFKFPIETEQLYTVVIPAASPYGLLLCLTQPVAGTVQNSVSWA